jgi:hypothetical protein
MSNGFANRLSLTPLRGSAPRGQLAGAVVALLGTLVYLAVGVTFGVDIKAASAVSSC